MTTRLILLLLLMTQAVFAQKKIEIANISDGTFSQKTIRNVNWMNDGQFYTALADNKIIRYDITGEEPDSIIFDGSDKSVIIDDYEFSADEKQMLLMTGRKSIYRRSYTALFYAVNFKDKSFEPLSENGRQSYATFSPDGKMVAFTRDNNLFMVRLVNMAEMQITEDGKKNEIINGSTDWVYEEEFSLTKAFFWSPDSRRIAYMRFDEREVKEYNMQKWNNVSLYPEDYKFKYPKAGEANSLMAVKIFDIEESEFVDVNLGKETDIYIPRVQWTKNNTLLSILRLNRLQNKLDVMHADARTGSVEVVFTDRSRTFIDMNYVDDLIYLNDGRYFLISSERKGYKHFFLHTMDGQTANQITSGLWEATELVGLDQSSKTAVLYYTSTELSPKDRALYKINIKGSGKELLSPETGGWVRADMSKDFKYYLQYLTLPETPVQVSLIEAKTNEPVKVLEDNNELVKKHEEYGLAQKQYFTFETVNKTKLDGYLLQPADFDSTRQYPVLIYQYSGPGSQNVTNNYAGGHYIWHQLLVQEGYIVAVIDTRGTGGRGEEFKKLTYKELGKLEVEDHIAGGKFLGSLPFVDKDRIGIWGWSYGGYMSSLAMFKGAEVFKTGIAVAPVTTWRFYDTVYTERYLQRPQDNPSGYDNNSPLSHVEKLKGNFLLIHGTGDDNVHFQNSVAMQEALIDAGKDFRSFYYPDKAHGIRGDKTRDHVYMMMTNFIKEKL